MGAQNNLILATNVATMSSREIAELTGKRHDHVCRDVVNMLTELNEDVPSFGAIYRDSMNREQTEYRLDKELTQTLLTGYSAALRRKVIARWNELEASPPRVQNPSTQAIIDSLLKFDALEQEQRKQAAEIVQLTSGLRTLEARTQPENKHFTVMGWANLQGHKIDITKAAKLGRQCSALSKELGVPTGEVSDPRFGKVKSYHESVLTQVMAA